MTTLYLTSGLLVLNCIVEQLKEAVTQSSNHQPYRPSSQEAVHWLQDPELDIGKDLAAQKEQKNISWATVRDGVFLDEFKGAMNKERWARLHQYTQHWLVKLAGEGPDFYDQAFIAICRLDTACRVDYSVENPTKYGSFHQYSTKGRMPSSRRSICCSIKRICQPLS